MALTQTNVAPAFLILQHDVRKGGTNSKSVLSTLTNIKVQHS